MQYKKYKFEELPAPGDAFYFRLRNGACGVCRVIRRSNVKETKGWGRPSILCAGCAWQGKSLPDACNPALRRIGTVVELRGKREIEEPELIWISEPPPKEFTHFGVITPTADESKLRALVCSEWGMFVTQREDELPEELSDDETARPTNAEFLEQARLRDWQEGVPKKGAAAIRRALLATVKEIAEADAMDRQTAALAAVKACVRKLNVIDAKHGLFIGTIEREDLCDILCGLLESAGVEDSDDFVDAEREW